MTAPTLATAALAKGRAGPRTPRWCKRPEAGTVTTSVTLKKALTDKSYTIHVSSSRKVTDPAKTLKLKKTSNLVKIANLAPREQVMVTVDG